VKLKVKQKTKDRAIRTYQKQVNSCAPEGVSVPAPLVIPVRLLFNDKIITWYGNCANRVNCYSL